MKIQLPQSTLLAFKKAGAKWNKLDDLLHYSHRETLEVDLEALTPEDREMLYDIVQVSAERTCQSAAKKMVSFELLKQDAAGARITKLTELETALRNYIKDSKHKWLFGEENDESICPYYVSGVSYCPPTNHSPPYVVMSMEYMERGKIETSNISFHKGDIVGGRNVVQLLAAKGYHLEKEELIKTYDASMKRYDEISTKTGEQYSAIGMARGSGRYSYGLISMEVDGEPTKTIMDDVHGDESDSKKENQSLIRPGSFWTIGGDDDDDTPVTEGEAESSFIAPVHPYVKVFNLRKHSFNLVHVDFLADYQWSTGLQEKLVLDAEKKDLIGMLVTGAGEVLDDIVKGKTGGVIVLSTGEPGTGKTLTAEIYSEEIKRPLYPVQCSQLGVDIDAIEKNLMPVLTRATRWKAILLIDEADVYIHERGDDIQQNAIVGVFLRVVEYYRGILFMTSNRANVVDDAIISRLTAHVRYDYPSAADAARIWQILSTQYQIKLTPAIVQSLTKAFPRISGRNIKNLLKLARMFIQKKNEMPTVELFVRIAKFQDGIEISDETKH